MMWIFLVGLVLLCAGVVMVLSAAFRYRVAWGVAILLMPLIYPLYAVLHWSESPPRNGFLVSVVGLLVVAVALYGGAGRDLLALVSGVPSEQVQSKVQELVEKVPTAAPSEKPLPNEAEAAKVSVAQEDSYDPVLGDGEFAFQKIEPLPPKEDKRVKVVQPAVPSEFQELAPALASQFQGKRARLTTKAGELKEGVLKRSHADSVVMEIPFQGGVAAFEFPFSDIEQLSVYAARGVVAAMAPPQPAAEASQPSDVPRSEAVQPEAPAPAGAQVAQPEAPAPVGAQVAQPEAPAPAGAQVAQPQVPAPAGARAAQPQAPAPVEAPPVSADEVTTQPGAAVSAVPPGEAAVSATGSGAPGVTAPAASPELPVTDPGSAPAQTGTAHPAAELLQSSPAPPAGGDPAPAPPPGVAEPPEAVSIAPQAPGPDQSAP